MVARLSASHCRVALSSMLNPSSATNNTHRGAPPVSVRIVPLSSPLLSRQVDSFSEQIFCGNPAAVFFTQAGGDADWMQKVRAMAMSLTLMTYKYTVAGKSLALDATHLKLARAFFI